jgi:20S proteasome alpha/beta subunit
MTIAAGFLCHDGIVLAADTLYTGENKRDAAKLWIFQKGENVVGIAGAGDATLHQASQV